MLQFIESLPYTKHYAKHATYIISLKFYELPCLLRFFIFHGLGGKVLIKLGSTGTHALLLLLTP